MENASKALFISGSILIAILILGIGIYLFATYSQVGEDYDQMLTTNEIIKFNSNFEKFEGREDITAQEIVTLQNFVDDYNSKMERIITTINIQGVVFNIQGVTNERKAEFIEINSFNDTRNEKVYFTCLDIEPNDTTGLIQLITFRRIN